MINLYLNYYTDKNPHRDKELVECLRINELNPEIDRIFAIVNLNVYHSVNTKTTFLYKKERPTFKDFFEEINRNELTTKDTISIISNSDIYFKDLSLVKENLGENDVFALGRWETLKNGVEIPFGRNDSQDCWCFKGQIKPVKDCDYKLGTAGVDNTIADRLSKAGYVVKNPSVSIRTYHLHNIGVRNYNPKETTPKPYLLINPNQIFETPIYTEKK